jgi:hypothetical protein
VIQSHNISQTLKDENFIKSLYFMKMKKIEYYSLLKQLNDEYKLIFDDVMHRKQLYPNTPICLLLQEVLELVKTFTLKFTT